MEHADSSSSSSPPPTYSEGATTDEWGQFTDFDDDYQNEPAGRIFDDPFRSISKTMLKRRGDKLSVCKLDQLQEEEEDDEEEY